MGIQRKPLLLLSAAAIAVFGSALACSSPGDPPAPTATCAPAKLVVGLQGQPGLDAVVGRLRLTTDVNGADQHVASFASSDGRPMFPRELLFEQAASEPGRRLTMSVEAFDKSGGASPIVVRLADAPFLCGETRLVRLRLEAQCLTAGFSGAIGPVCTAPQSCQSGRCASGSLIASDLEPYSAGWASDVFDACKPPNAGPPEVIVGTGQTDFRPLVDAPISPEKGPQGGHHLWIGVRMKNLKQSGSTTTITGLQPATGVTLPVTSFVFTFDRDDGGYCKIFGLRYQLDNASTPVETFMGKPLDVTVEVKDTTGLSAKSTVRVNVATTVIVPVGL